MKAAPQRQVPCGPMMTGDSFFVSNLTSQSDAASSAPDIKALTRAARGGDANAFCRLYDVYSFRVYKFLLVLAHGDENEAREVCQTLFIKLAKRWDVFEDEQRLWAWLCTLAKNAFVDHWRAKQRLNRLISLDKLSNEADVHVPEEYRLSELLREGLAALPLEERELIQAAYVDNRPLQELAEEAGLTYKAVESRLGRLRQKLKQQLLKNLRHET